MADVAKARPLDAAEPTGDVRSAAMSPAHPVDLHTHSTESDGTLSPAGLVREAHRRGVRVLGLTDHDTVDGLAEAEAAAAGLGIEIVAGVELSTGGPEGEVGGEIHLLGYFVDRHDPALRAGLAEYAGARLVRMERIVERLVAAGVPVDPARVRAIAGPGTVGRPHVARALVEAGHAADVGDAFARWLGAGRPAFVPRPKLEPEDGIALIRAAGGVAVLAHPLSTGDAAGAVARLVPAGLDGMEVFYGEYDDDARRELGDVAARWRMVATGGSDFHGPGVKAGRELGGAPVPIEAVERLRDLAPSAVPRPGRSR